MIIFGVVSVIAFIVGLIEGDPEVTGDIAGFMISTALWLGIGIYLVRRYRRRGPQSSNIR